ncbi:Hypothetical protein ETEE_0002 [Edwardsiella anguillarum ET080813]|uniref:Uncharacterized protein n=1 Tax=Edwardsiella anguillarum ET080813 TaxID=667120 RepID=A0A076LIX6_9GAMM|nr:Hypothetical protein ETEE_0002 [Edwardsiella anguillarum ET080813]
MHFHKLNNRDNNGVEITSQNRIIKLFLIFKVAFRIMTM